MTSYQKQKVRIAELEKSLKERTSELFILSTEPESDEAFRIGLRFRHVKAQEEQLMLGGVYSNL